MSNQSLSDYARFSTGYAVAALGFSVARYNDVADLRLIAAIAHLSFAFSAGFGFMTVSALATSSVEKESMESAGEKKRIQLSMSIVKRKSRINRYGVFHVWLFLAGLFSILVLVIAELFYDLEFRTPTIRVDCLESILRGWPVCL